MLDVICKALLVATGALIVGPLAAALWRAWRPDRRRPSQRIVWGPEEL